MANVSRKRKLVSVDLKVKLKAIEEINNGMPLSAIADNLHVHTATVRSWVKSEEKLRQWEEERNGVLPSNVKRLRKPDNQLVEQALTTWFRENCRAGCPINSSILKIQALHFWKALGGAKTFQASQGWLTKWQKRHNIPSVTISDAKLSADVESAVKYKDRFLQIVKEENLSPEQIFNCYETGLNYRTMPKTTLSEKAESATSGMKGLKERITVMACSNSSGTCKPRLVVIGKFAKPRAIKNLKKLPVSYKSQKSAWMISTLFEAWFYEEFVPEVKNFLQVKGLPQKAILFVDNCDTHAKNLSSEGIRVEFLPANTTSVLLPMDQGCLKALKVSYRQRLMTFILNEFNKGYKLIDTLKKISIREVIDWIADAWNTFPQSTIIRSWKPLWPNIEEIVQTHIESAQNQFLLNAMNQLAHQFFSMLCNQEQYRNLEMSSIDSWLNPLHSCHKDEILNDTEIIQVVTQEEEEVEKRDVEGVEKKDKIIGNLREKKSLTDLREYLDILVDHCQGSPHYTKDHLLALIMVRKALIIESLMPQNQDANNNT